MTSAQEIALQWLQGTKKDVLGVGGIPTPKPALFRPHSPNPPIIPNPKLAILLKLDPTHTPLLKMCVNSKEVQKPLSNQPRQTYQGLCIVFGLHEQGTVRFLPSWQETKSSSHPIISFAPRSL